MNPGEMTTHVVTATRTGTSDLAMRTGTSDLAMRTEEVVTARTGPPGGRMKGVIVMSVAERSLAGMSRGRTVITGQR